MRNVFHVGVDIQNFEMVVHRQADVQAMNGIAGRQWTLAGNDEVIGFDVGQSGFNVPQAVFTLKA